jgi:hypothetical protein
LFCFEAKFFGQHCSFQEELAFGSMEPQGTIFCAQMQIRILDILLDEIYSSEEYFLERSRVLIRKAGVLRSSGMKNISNCLEFLSKSISLLAVSLNHLIQFLIYPEKEYLRLIFIHQISKTSLRIYLKEIQLRSINWLLHTACMHIALRRAMMTRRKAMMIR